MQALNDGSFLDCERNKDGEIPGERDRVRMNSLVQTKIHQYSIAAFLFRRKEFIGRRESHRDKKCVKYSREINTHSRITT